MLNLSKWISFKAVFLLCIVLVNSTCRKRCRFDNCPEGQECRDTPSGVRRCYDVPAESNYYFGTESVSWNTANATCEEMSARLVILESQEEIDFLEAKVTSFEHWIGMTCESNNCHWVDGQDVNTGFTAWAPNEPQGRNCTWIGYYGNKWDDNYCDWEAKYICEFP